MAFCKGMGKLCKKLKDGIAFPDSTRKAEADGCDMTLQQTLDITMFTDHPMSTPMLNGSIAAALKVGVAMLPDPDKARG